MQATGKCLCGSVTFQADKVPSDVHSCHCGMCQRWNGGPAIAAHVGAITFTGNEHIRRFSSSDWAERGFCKNCGTSLFYCLKDGEQYFVCVGTFDDLSAFRLTGEIYIDEKPAAYDFVGDHSRMTGAEFMAMMQEQT